MTNWPQIKFQYETLGEPLETLATKHGVSLVLLENIRHEEKWQVKPVAREMVEWGDSEKPSDIMVEVADKAQLLDTLRATTLGPEYYKAEAAFVNKLVEVIASVDANDDDAAKQLAKLSDCLVAMRPARTADASGGGNSGLTVNILGGYGVCDNTPAQVSVDIPKQLEN